MDYAELVMQLEYTKAVLWVHAWSARERIAALLPPAREASPTPRSVGRDESLPSMGIRWTLDHLPESERTETHAELLTRVTRHFEVSIARTRQPPAAARELFAACDGRGPAVSSVVLEALTRGRRASGKLPAQAVERIAEDLAQYLSVERSAITTINDLRAEINVALGVDAEPTPIGEADITKIFGSTPRDLVSEAVAVAP